MKLFPAGERRQGKDAYFARRIGQAERILRRVRTLTLSDKEVADVGKRSADGR
jgi:hypothetical protein